MDVGMKQTPTVVDTGPTQKPLVFMDDKSAEAIFEARHPEITALFKKLQGEKMEKSLNKYSPGFSVSAETEMNSKAIIQRYFQELFHLGPWQKKSPSAAFAFKGKSIKEKLREASSQCHLYLYRSLEEVRSPTQDELITMRQLLLQAVSGWKGNDSERYKTFQCAIPLIIHCCKVFVRKNSPNFRHQIYWQVLKDNVEKKAERKAFLRMGRHFFKSLSSRKEIGDYEIPNYEKLPYEKSLAAGVAHILSLIKQLNVEESLSEHEKSELEAAFNLLIAKLKSNPELKSVRSQIEKIATENTQQISALIESGALIKKSEEDYLQIFQLIPRSPIREMDAVMEAVEEEERTLKEEKIPDVKNSQVQEILVVAFTRAIQEIRNGIETAEEVLKSDQTKLLQLQQKKSELEDQLFALEEKNESVRDLPILLKRLDLFVHVTHGYFKYLELNEKNQPESWGSWSWKIWGQAMKATSSLYGSLNRSHHEYGPVE